MAKNVPMFTVIDGETTCVGSVHPAKVRHLTKKGLARWKGKRLYLIQPEPEAPDEPEHLPSPTPNRCPTCGIGIDNDGDGNCVHCAPRDPRLTRSYEDVSRQQQEAMTALSLTDRALPVLDATLGKYLRTPTVSGGQTNIPFQGSRKKGWDVHGWVEVWPNTFSIYLNRVWPTGRIIEGVPETEESQEVVHISNRLVVRGSPTGAKDPYDDTPSLEAGYHPDDLMLALEAETLLIAEVLKNPRSTPPLVESPIPEGNHPYGTYTQVRSAGALYAAFSEARESGRPTCDHTHGNVGFGFQVGRSNFTWIGLSHFKTTRGQRPDAVPEAEWAAFIEAMLTPVGRRGWFAPNDIDIDTLLGFVN